MARSSGRQSKVPGMHHSGEPAPDDQPPLVGSFKLLSDTNLLGQKSLLLLPDSKVPPWPLPRSGTRFEPHSPTSRGATPESGKRSASTARGAHRSGRRSLES